MCDRDQSEPELKNSDGAATVGPEWEPGPTRTVDIPQLTPCGIKMPGNVQQMRPSTPDLEAGLTFRCIEQSLFGGQGLRRERTSQKEGPRRLALG